MPAKQINKITIDLCVHPWLLRTWKITLSYRKLPFGQFQPKKLQIFLLSLPKRKLIENLPLWPSLSKIDKKSNYFHNFEDILLKCREILLNQLKAVNALETDQIYSIKNPKATICMKTWQNLELYNARWNVEKPQRTKKLPVNRKVL